MWAWMLKSLKKVVRGIPMMVNESDRAGKT